VVLTALQAQITTLFPYTTLFRSISCGGSVGVALPLDCAGQVRVRNDGARDERLVGQDVAGRQLGNATEGEQDSAVIRDVDVGDDVRLDAVVGLLFFDNGLEGGDTSHAAVRDHLRQTSLQSGGGSHAFGDLGADGVVLVGRDGHGGQDADDRNHDHQFDK